MPLQFIREDITKMRVDAVVNAANGSLLGGGGVDGAIHYAAGSGLLEECRKLGGCKTGEAKITGGYKMPCKYIIHTVGPVWSGGGSGEENLLRSCYLNSLALAAEHKCRSVAFPLISSGVYGYPKVQALQVAERAIIDFLADFPGYKNGDDMLVYIVIYNKDVFEIGSKLFGKIEQRINDFEVSQAEAEEHHRRLSNSFLGIETANQPDFPLAKKAYGKAKKSKAEESGEEFEPDLLYYDEPMLCESVAFDEKFELDESFSEMLLRKIDEKGLTDPQCYKKANIDRKLFSKIRKNKKYKPTKQTVLALAIALELPPGEVDEMLRKAGYAFSPSLLFDVIVSYCIEHGEYNIFEINEILFKHDQPLLC